MMNRFKFDNAVKKPALVKLHACLRYADVTARGILLKLANYSKAKSLISRVRLSDWTESLKCGDLINLSRFAGFVGHIKSCIRRKVADRSAISAGQLDMSALNCRVRLAEHVENNHPEAFRVEICGSIRAPAEVLETDRITLKVSILDITDGVAKTKPVRARVKQRSLSGEADSSTFCYQAELGKLPNQITTLSGWTEVAQLPLDWLALPRRGESNLQFEISVSASETGEELAHARSTFTYENLTPGYMDLQENVQRAKTLTVTLAFAVSAADGRIFDCEVEVIKDWARANLFENPEQICNRVKRKLDKALDSTIAFFRGGHQVDMYEICREMAEISPIGRRYDTLDLCLHVAQAKGSVAAAEMGVLKNLSTWLDLDAERSRLMMQKVLPIQMHEVKDVETILGITSDMSEEKARKQLNRQYSKWNSRVINSDPRIQSQADQMLKLIAETRNQYATK